MRADIRPSKSLLENANHKLYHRPANPKEAKTTKQQRILSQI